MNNINYNFKLECSSIYGRSVTIEEEKQIMNENDFLLKQGERLVSQQVKLMMHSICFMLKNPDYYKEVFYLLVKVRIAECEGYITALYHVSHITDCVYDQFMDVLQMLNEELADIHFNLK